MLLSRAAEHNGRTRKYYRITKRGLARIEEFKTDWQEMLAIHRLIVSQEGDHE